MTTPSLRILIADAQHQQRLSIEKMLNLHGYHRVAPIGSFDELLVMVEHAVMPFDLLVINSAMFGAGVDIDEFCHLCPCIRHALVYDGLASLPELNEQEYDSKVIQKLPGAPDSQTLRKLMQFIDHKGAVNTLSERQR